jgi:hypothetical protein
MSHSEVFTPRACRLTTQKVIKRLAREGPGFLTKSLPRLAKAFDRALTGEVPLDAISCRFTPMAGSKLPKLLGELFVSIFSHDGWVLPTPCVKCIKNIRLFLLVYYKYELPYETSQERDVIDQFVKTEEDILPYHESFEKLSKVIDADPNYLWSHRGSRFFRIIRSARIRLAKVFQHFDVTDIKPRHGPGAVSTKERLWGKYTWSSVSPRIIETYPLDAYFYASLGHVCDAYEEIQNLILREQSARVILVPKDSRGPRLISCEPLCFQWIQQGLGRAMMRHVERHKDTKCRVNFTNQQPNQIGALYGSLTGEYATLDLSEASDRITVGLVHLLFPEPLLRALMNCRRLSTELPSGQHLSLNKFAPMGSALCFPVLALTVWALLNAGAPDADTRERILVYGDDVIVPTAQAADAIHILESFGLKINRDKSCTSGFFRESCGVDAYKGTDVTPVRFRTVWTNHLSPSVFESWIAYANSLYRRQYFNTYYTIVDRLVHVYGRIPEQSMGLPVPSLVEVPEDYRPNKWRTNTRLQKREWRVTDVKSRPISKEIDGWKMLLRTFAETGSGSSPCWSNDNPRRCGVAESIEENIIYGSVFSASSYTKRDTGILVSRWR